MFPPAHKISSHRYQVVVFDVDGTLADTFGCLSASTDIALTRFGLPPADPLLLRSAIGLSPETIFRTLTDATLTPAELDSLVAVFRSAFREICSNNVRLFAGIREQIHTLLEAGVTLAVATSKSRRGAEELLRDVGIGNVFSAIATDDMVIEKKPHPEMLQLISETLDVPPHRAVMVGDAEFDIRMGHAAGMATCAVTWGNQSVERLAAQNPAHIVSSPHELADTLLWS